MLELSNLEKAINNLEYWLYEIQNNQIMLNASDQQRDGFRAGLIQYYEVAYEASCKMIERWLKNNTTSSKLQDFFRLAYDCELIDDINAWREYKNFRNDTSHEYDEEKANTIFIIINS